MCAATTKPGEKKHEIEFLTEVLVHGDWKR